MSTDYQNLKHVEEIDRTLAYKGSILDIYDMQVRLPDGNVQDWDLVHHRKGAACVLPVLNDGRFVMVRQYRPALGRWTVEIPGGARDSVTEDTRETVARELEEETGYQCARVDLLMKLKTTVAFCDEAIDVYVATGLKSTHAQHLDEAEAIAVELWKPEDVLLKIYTGEIQDAKTVAAVTGYCLKAGVTVHEE